MTDFALHTEMTPPPPPPQKISDDANPGSTYKTTKSRLIATFNRNCKV